LDYPVTARIVLGMLAIAHHFEDAGHYKSFLPFWSSRT
jgi:hypothetical protein